MDEKKKSIWVLAVSGVLAVAGVCCGVYKWIAGEQVTGLSSLIIWGLEAAGIYTAAACGTGLLALTGVKELTGKITPLERGRLLIAATAAFIATGCLVMIDLSNPVNIIGIVTAGAVSSFMTWDFYLLTTATVVAVVYFAMTRSGRGNKVMAILSIVVAVAVLLVEAMMTTSVLGREVWANGLTVIEFLVGALVVGGVAVNAIAPSKQAALTAAISAVVLAVCVLTELMATTSLSLLVVSPFLWVGLAALVAVAVLGFMDKLPLTNFVVASIGVLCEKVWVLAYGQATHLFAADTLYNSSLVEWAIVIGVAALGVFLYEACKGLAGKKDGAGAKGADADVTTSAKMAPKAAVSGTPATE